MKTKKAVIFGTKSFADIAYFYLQNDSEYEVCAFCATNEFLDVDTLFGLPVVSFEGIEEKYPPAEYEMFIAIGYINLNKTRARFCELAREKGYHLLTYISSKATVWGDLTIGYNCFILEDNTLQPYLVIGDNVIMWSGNHIGHHSVIEDHCYIASHAVISGHVRIREYSFVGVNATIRDTVTIERENIIGAAAVILKNTKEKQVFATKSTPLFPRDSSRVKI